MSACYIHQCPACGFEVEGWDDGNPYILDDRGRPQFFYHPNWQRREEILASCRWALGKNAEEMGRLLELNSGNMSEFLCLKCAAIFKCDEEKKRPQCKKCRGTEVLDVMRLAGVRCPKCGRGSFPAEPVLGGVS